MGLLIGEIGTKQSCLNNLWKDQSLNKLALYEISIFLLFKIL